ncbi:MAG: porphobilinogen synthase, partial [Planctomycetes bacterium]|nr:porphobilinogen synthase [Planctomycetota bacterium]
MRIRPRRNRSSATCRNLVAEHSLSAEHFVLPLFVHEGQQLAMPIASMPGQARLSIDLIVEKVQEAIAVGVCAFALFPALDDDKKDALATEGANSQGLLQRCIRAIKEAAPEAYVITDVACDPYSSDGHDGLLQDNKILNDETLPVLAAMAVAQAQAGSDMVAPSDMMDGR